MNTKITSVCLTFSILSTKISEDSVWQASSISSRGSLVASELE